MPFIGSNAINLGPVLTSLSLLDYALYFREEHWRGQHHQRRQCHLFCPMSSQVLYVKRMIYILGRVLEEDDDAAGIPTEPSGLRAP